MAFVEKSKHPFNIAAFTITEVLVVMLVSGILLLAIYEGMGTIKKYTNGLVSQLENSNELLGGMVRLEALLANADSVCRSEERYMFYGEGEPVAVWRHDSLIIVEFPARRDTLFRSVRSLWDKTLPTSDRGRIDSLFVALELGDRSVLLGFAPVTRDGKVMEQVREEEKAYIEKTP